jgi:hypothetical protein
VIVKELTAPLHKYAKSFAVFATGQMLADALTNEIVRSGKGISVVYILPKHTMAIRHSNIKMAHLI